MYKRLGPPLVIVTALLSGCGTNTGALTGAATSPSQIDLGRPAWEQ
jgi:hypothetical protein